MSKGSKITVFAMTLSLILIPLFAHAQEVWIKNYALCWPNKEAWDGFKRQTQYLTDEQTIGFIVGAIHFKAALILEAQPVTSLLEDQDSVTIRLNDGRVFVTTSAKLAYK